MLHFEAIDLLSLVLAVGIGAQWLAARLHLPALVLLLGAGLILGRAGTGILDPDATFGPLLEPFISLAVALVLFEGGLSLDLREARVAGRTLWRLILAGLCVGGASMTLLAHYVAGLSLPTSAVLGAILVVTGPTVILPMLRTARISLRPATLLKWEGIVNDPLGAMLAIFVFQAALLGGEAGASQGRLALLLGLVLHTVLAGAIGASVGFLLGRGLRTGWIPEHLKSPVILAAVLVVHSVTEFSEESGLLGVTAMGIVLANVKDTSIADIRRFKEQISAVLVAFLFIVLSARIEPGSLRGLLGMPLVLVALVLFVVRPFVVLVASFGTKLPWRERALVGWIAPRGVVAAAVAGAFEPRLVEAGYDDSGLLVPIVFGVIISAALLHGLSIRPLARRLGLGAVPGGGILIVGAADWCVALAQALARAGAFVVLADTRYPRVSQARREGLEVHFGDVLSAEASLTLPLERVSFVLAATDDDAYNALVCSNYAHDLGRTAALQLTPVVTGSRKEAQHHMMGRTPWGAPGSYPEIARTYWQGGSFKVTTITESFRWEDLVARSPGAVFLFGLSGQKLYPIDQKKVPPIGSKVISLTAEPGEPTGPAPAEPAPSTVAAGSAVV